MTGLVNPAVGARMARTEDQRLLRGEGQFVDDIHLPGTLTAAFVRSPHPHARIRSIDARTARSLPGVRGVYTASDLPELSHPLPQLVPHPIVRQPYVWQPLASEEVCFTGEPVAMVVADDRYLAEDAVDAISVGWEVVAAAGDCRAAIAPAAPSAHLQASDNVAARFPVSVGDVESAFASAPHVLSEALFIHRGGCHAIECRAALARYEPAEDLLTLWSATQSPHGLKGTLMGTTGWRDDQVRVISPDVGGGFGPKGIPYPEDVALAIVARHLGCPVRWTEDRREHFLATTQERDQYWDLQIAVEADGRIAGVRGQVVHDTGAYLPFSIIVPYLAAVTFPGPYVVPALELEVVVALTNKVPTSPLRGAGRPQGVFAMERLMDRVARELGLDRAEVRRRNLIPPERMPYPVGLIYRDGSPLTYDSGDYPATQRLALDASGYESFPDRQARARQEGVFVGIGLANYVEGTGLGPYEGATLRITRDGSVLLTTGSAPQGQGHETTFAQICADALGVRPDVVQVTTGDTAGMAVGIGTFASRSVVNAGSAVHLVAQDVRAQLLAVASGQLDVPLEDLELQDGVVRPRGAAEPSITLAEIAWYAAGAAGFTLPEGVSPALASTRYFTPTQATYSNGCHVAEVECDVETGLVRLLRYTVAHDCGRVVNPLVVDGQVIGGVAHGLGNALFERMRYADDARPVTTSLQDYLLTTAECMPPIELRHLETPTPLNPLGVKGAGEGGTIPVPAAVAAAVENALEPFGVRISEMPLSPERLLDLLRGAEGEHRS